MKKLMTMLSAVALAFGVQAATWYSGTSFETMTAGEALDLSSGEGLMWATNGTAQTLTVEALPSNPYEPNMRPTYFRNPALSGDEAGYANALSVKTTFGNPVYRNNTEAKTMGTLYVDALVKPTICEDDEITLDSGAKIAIWFKEILDANDDPVSTNLMITAGYLTSPTTAVSTNYDCGAITGADQWQRFTVKSFATVDSRSGYVTPGFAVYRNGDLVTCAAAKGDSNVTTFDNLDVMPGAYAGKGGLFPSRVQGGDADVRQQISAIGFDGTGSVDDILFSDDEPGYAVQFKTVTLTWDEHVTGFKYTVGSKPAVTNSNLVAAGSEVVAVEEGESITITEDSYATGYKRGVFTAGEGITTNGNEFSIANFSTYVSGTSANIVSEYDAPNVQIGDGTEHYTTLALAFDAINNKSGEVAVKINADGLTFPTGGLTLDGPNLTGVTLDLAGHTITYAGEGYALTASKPLTITNSTVTVGGITALQVVTSSDSLTIYDGVFSGAVTITAGDAAISGGTFNGAVSATSAKGFITGGTFANDYSDPEIYGYLALGYGITDDGPAGAGPYTVGLATYSITYYDADGVTPLVLSPVEYTFGEAITLPTPEKGGYSFGGWLSDDEPFTYVAGTTAGELVLNASWTKQPVTVTVAGGANITISSITTNSVAVAAPAAADYVVGYGEGVQVVYAAAEHYTINGAATYTTNITATAAVTITPPAAVIDSFTVKFISGEGSTTQTVVKAYNATIEANEVDAAAAVAGKTFTAWDPAIEFPYTVTANATFTAQYASSGPAPIDPSNPAPVEVEAVSEEAAIAAVELATPSAAGSEAADVAAYKNLFTITATEKSTGVYTVEVTGIKEETKEAVSATAVDVLSGKDTGVTVPPGLYYRITRYTAIGTPIVETPASGQSTKANSKITVSKPGDTQGFIKIEMSSVDFN